MFLKCTKFRYAANVLLNSSRHFIPTYVQVAAHVLGQPEKAFWKNCVLEEKEEIELAEKFRDAFEPFDFSL